MNTNNNNLPYKISKISLVILLITPPILLGSNRYILELLNLMLALIAISFFIMSGNMAKLLNGLNLHTKNILIFMFFFIPLWIAIQASPIVPKILYHPISALFNISGPHTISLNPGLTWSSLIVVVSRFDATPFTAYTALKENKNGKQNYTRI